MKPKLYLLHASPACRAVLITIKYLGIDVEYHEMKWPDEFHEPYFLKLNPQHTVPTLVDENRSIWDSHAINIYLISKYGKNNDLYPEDFFQRAVVNQRMYFDDGKLYPLLIIIDRGYFKKKFKQIPAAIVDEVKENYDILEKCLEGHKWIAGNILTIADFSLMTTVTSLDDHIPVEPDVFPNITSWLKKVQMLPCCAEDDKHLKMFKEFMDSWRAAVNVVE